MIGTSGALAADDVDDDAVENSVQDETIVITATRRRSTVQTTAISVNAFSGKELEEQGYNNIGQFIDAVPGIIAEVSGPTGTRIIFRNLSTSTQETGSPTTAIYLDDFALGGGGSSIRLVDMERVEVLKGPQGTLFGRSAMGGIVRFISNKAHSDSIEAGFNTYLSNTTDGGDNYGGHAYLNLPITDTFSVRLVGYDYQNDGFLDNVELDL